MNTDNPNSSALDTLIAKARSDEQRFLRELERVKRAGDQGAGKRLKRKADNAHRKLGSLNALRTLSKDWVVELAETAQQFRHIARSLRGKGKAASFERKAAALEKRYQLWCDYHGKTPARRAEVSGKAAQAAKDLAAKGSRGGRRPGAGRPRAGNVQILIRLKPETAMKLHALASAARISPGQWLDQNLRLTRPS